MLKRGRRFAFVSRALPSLYDEASDVPRFFMEKFKTNKCIRCGNEVSVSFADKTPKYLSGLILCRSCYRWVREYSETFVRQAKKLLIVFEQRGFETKLELSRPLLADFVTLEVKCKRSTNKAEIRVYNALQATVTGNSGAGTADHWYPITQRLSMLKVPDNLLAGSFWECSTMVIEHVTQLFEILRFHGGEGAIDEPQHPNISKLKSILYQLTQQNENNLQLQLRLSKALDDFKNDTGTELTNINANENQDDDDFYMF